MQSRGDLTRLLIVSNLWKDDEMKKLPIVLCLMILGIVLLNSHVYAVYVYEVESFKQHNTATVLHPFEDEFDDNIAPQNPSTVYKVGSSGPLSEAGGVLVLDGALGEDGPGTWTGAGLIDGGFFFH
jgi:hypothetical protein